MTVAKRRTAVIALVLAVCIGPWGCALKRHPLPQSPSAEVRAQFNTIGLPAARFLPEAQLKAPTSGKGMGAAKGAGYGIVAGVGPGLIIASSVRGCGGARELGAVLCGAVALFGLGVAAAGGTVGALGGTVYGAVTAEPASRISAAEIELKSAVVDLNVQETLRDHVLRTVQDRSSLNFFALDDRGPTAVGEPIDYRTLASEGVDTVVEVSVPKIRLAGQGGIDPPVALSITARARVIRTADGVEVYAEKFEYHSGGAYKFLEWAAGEGLAFRQEVDRGTRSLADDIVRLLFPPDPARDSAPAAQSAEPVAAATASSEPLAAATPSSVVPVPTVEAAVTGASYPISVNPQLLAVLGNWQGTFKPQGSRSYPATLRIFEDNGQLRWELTRIHEGQELAGSGGASVSEANVTLTGTYQPSPGPVFQRVWTGSRPVQVTYSLTRVGVSLVGSGIGADNRVETLSLMRGLGQ